MGKPGYRGKDWWGVMFPGTGGGVGQPGFNDQWWVIFRGHELG